MAAPPLTHHEILELVQPFTRRVAADITLRDPAAAAAAQRAGLEPSAAAAGRRRGS